MLDLYFSNKATWSKQMFDRKKMPCVKIPGSAITKQPEIQTAFSLGLRSRWTFRQRTIPDIGSLFPPSRYPWGICSFCPSRESNVSARGRGRRGRAAQTQRHEARETKDLVAASWWSQPFYQSKGWLVKQPTNEARTFWTPRELSSASETPNIWESGCADKEYFASCESLFLFVVSSVTGSTAYS